MPEPKAGLKGNPAKTKEIFSQDHPHFPDKCANCHLNSAGKVHGVKKTQNISDVSRKEAKGNCEICDAANTCKERINTLANPITNPNLIAEKGYEKTLFVHKNADEKDKKENITEAKHILDKNFSHLSAIIINEDIKENGLPNQEYTFIYKNGRKLYGDRKGAEGESGITNGFRRAVNEQCDKVLVIEFNSNFKRDILKIDECAKNLCGRIDDFKKGLIVECYIIREDKVALFDKDFMLSGDKNTVKGKIIKALSNFKIKKEN